MILIIYSGRFGQSVAQAIAAHHQQRYAAMQSWQEWQADPVMQSMPGDGVTVYALFSGLNLAQAIALERQLAPGVRLVSCFAFERHVLIAPLSGSGGVCVDCFSRRLLCSPPAPYSAEVMYLLSMVDIHDAALQFQGFHPGITSLAAQLCIQQATSLSAAGTSTLFETNNVQLSTSRIMPLHGCQCHRNDGTRRTNPTAAKQRFSAFGKELASWMN